MKQLLILLQLLTFCITVHCQNQTEVDKGWKWVVPLETKKAEIEKVFGESITKDKKHPFQTYVADFGKITAIYTTKRKLIKACSCYVNAGTVLRALVYPKRFKLSELNYDLSQFKKDDTYSPRELSYYSAKDGIFIGTEIVELEDGSKIERVFTIEYRPKIKADK